MNKIFHKQLYFTDCLRKSTLYYTDEENETMHVAWPSLFFVTFTFTAELPGRCKLLQNIFQLLDHTWELIETKQSS